MHLLLTYQDWMRYYFGQRFSDCRNVNMEIMLRDRFAIISDALYCADVLKGKSDWLIKTLFCVKVKKVIIL